MMFPAGISPTTANPGFPLGINPGIKRIIVERLTIALQIQTSAVAFATAQSVVAFAALPVAQIAFEGGSSALAFFALTSALSFAAHTVEVAFDDIDTCPTP